MLRRFALVLVLLLGPVAWAPVAWAPAAWAPAGWTPAAWVTIARADQMYTVGSIMIEHPWALATDKMATTGAAYFELKNAGDSPDRLVSARTDVAGMAELHRTVNEGGMLRMLPISAIEIPAKGHVSVKPGVFHLMLVHLKAPLTAGEHFPLQLTFEKAGAVTIDVVVESAKGSPAPKPMRHDEFEPPAGGGGAM